MATSLHTTRDPVLSTMVALAENSFSSLKELSNQQGELKNQAIQEHSWLNKPDRWAVNEEDRKLFNHFSGELFSDEQSHLEIKKALDFLNTILTKTLAGSENGIAGVQPSALMRQRLEEVAKQFKGMRAIEEKIEATIAEGKVENEHRLSEEEAFALKEKRNTILDRLSTELSRQLARESQLWLPIGIHHGAHTEYYFCCVDRNKGEVSVIDTRNLFDRSADGQQLTPRLVSSRNPGSENLPEQAFVQQLIRIQSVDKKRLAHPDFFKMLLSPRILPAWHMEDSYSSKMFTTSLKSYLKGKLSLPTSGKHRVEEKKFGRGAEQTAKSLTSLLYYGLAGSFDNLQAAEEGRALYKRMKWEWQLALLLKQVKQFDLELTTLPAEDIQSRQLELFHQQQRFLGILKNLERAELKKKSHYCLTQEMQREFAATADHVRKVLSTLSEKLKKTDSKPVTENLSDLTTINPAASKSLKLQQTDLKKATENAQFLEREEARLLTGSFSKMAEAHPALLENPLGALQFFHQIAEPLTHFSQEIATYYEGLGIEPSLIRKYCSIGPEKWSNHWRDPEKLEQEIQLSRQLSAATDALLPSLAVAKEEMTLYYERLLKALPIPGTSEGEIWNQVPLDSIPAVLDAIHHLTETIVRNSAINGLVRTPQEILLQTNLVAIADLLVRRLPDSETHLMEFPHVACDTLLSCLRSSKTNFFSAWQHRYAEDLIRYLYKKEPESLMASLVEEGASNIVDLPFHENQTLFSNQFLYFSDDPKSASYQSRTKDYFLKFLERTDAEWEAKLSSIGIDRSMSQIEQLGKLISNAMSDSSILPASVRRLFQITAKNNYGLACSTFNKSDGAKIYSILSLPDLWKLQSNCTSSREVGRGHNEEFHTVNMEMKQFTNSGLAPYSYTYFSASLYEFDKTSALEQGEDGLVSTSLNQLMADIGQENYNYYRYSYLFKNSEERRDLSEIGINPYRTIAAATAFLRQHADLLDKKQIQHVLSTHLFRPLRLTNQMQNEPHVCLELLRAIGETYQHQYESVSESNQPLLFLAKLDSECRKILSESGLAIPDSIPCLKERVFRELLSKLKLEERQQFFKDEFAAYGKLTPYEAAKLTLDEQQALILAALSAQLSGEEWIVPKEAVNPLHEIQKVNLGLKRLLPWIKVRLETASQEERNKILSKLVGRFHFDCESMQANWQRSATGQWICRKPIPFALDLSQGTLIRGQGERQGDLPATISNHYLFKQLSKDFTHATLLHGTQIWILYPSGFQVDLSQQPLTFIKELENGKKVRLLEPSQCQILSAYGLSRELKNPNLTIELTYSQDEKATLTLKDRGKPTYEVDLRFSEIDESEEENSRDAFDDFDGPVASRAKAHEPYKQVEVECVRRLADGFIAVTREELTQELRSRLSLTNSFEFWRRPDRKELTSVTCHQYNLSFKNMDNGDGSKLYCSQYPGYFLAGPSLEEISYEFQGALVLQNRAGEIKVLISFENNELVEFQYKESVLEPVDLKAAISLGHSLARKMDYAALKALFPKLEHLQRYSSNEFNLLNSLSSNLIGSRHPEGAALGLALLVILEENRLKYPVAIGREDQDLISSNDLLEAYLSYCQYANNSSEYRLTKAQERRLLSMIHSQLLEQVKQGNWIEKKLAKMKMQIVMKLIGSRWVDVHANKPHLRDRRVQWETDLKLPEFPFLGFEVDSFVDLYKRQKSLSIPAWNVQGGGDNFRDYFWCYYKLIKEGNAAQKQQLKRYLDMHAHITSDMNGYRKILLKVLAKPKKFPSLTRLEQVYRSYEEAKNNWVNRSASYNSIEYKRLYRIYQKERAKLDKVYGTVSMKTGCVREFFVKLTILIKEAVKLIWKSIKLSWQTRVYMQKREIKTPLSRANRIQPLLKSSPVLVDTLKTVDRTFNHYFEQMINEHFDVAEEEPDLGVEGERLTADLADGDRLLERKLEEEQRELDEYRNQLTARKVYTLKAGKNLDGVHSEMKQMADFWNSSLKTQSQLLLWQVNRVPTELPHAILEQLKRTSVGKELNWEQLKELFLKNDIQAFKEHSLLSNEELKQLSLGFTKYQAILTQIHKLERLDALLQQYEQLSGTESHDPEKIQTLLQVFAEQALQSRAYALQPENFHMLSVEAAAKYFLTKSQIDKKSEMVNASLRHPCTLFQMPTGFGKTTAVNRVATYESTYLHRHATYLRQLVVNLWPEPLEITNSQENRQQFKEAYGRRVDRLSFDRSSLMMAESLKFIYEELKTDLIEGKPINIRPETIQAIKLHLHMLLETQLKEPNSLPEIRTQIDYLIRIRALVRTFGYGNIDEEHFSNNPISSNVIYTMGEAQEVPGEQLDLLQTLFEFMTDPSLQAVMPIRENQQSRTMEHHPEVYTNRLAPQLAERFCRHLKIAPGKRESFKKFVLGERDEIPAWLPKHPKRRDISLVKGLLSCVLKNCLQEAACEKYTFSKDHFDGPKPKEFAIPCESADKPRETALTPSQFKNVHEAICKTYLLYLHKGLRPKQVQCLLTTLKESCLTESLQGVPFGRTRANRLFREKLAPAGWTKPLNKLTAKDVEALTPHLLQNRDAILYYIRHIVSKQITVYPESFDSTASGMLSLFHKTTAVSATPLAAPTHAIEVDYHKMLGTSGHVTHLILRDGKHKDAFHIIPADEDHKQKSLEILASRPEVKAAVDISAWHKGHPNAEVADSLRSHLKNQGDNATLSIAFFHDHEGTLHLKDVESGHVHKVDPNNDSPHARKMLYSQDKSYGSDAKHAIDAIALLLLDQKTTKSATGQGAGRMRQWAKTQRVEFLLEDPVARKIFGEDGSGQMNEANALKLLVHLMRNEAHDRAEKTYRSQPQQMNDALQSVCADKIIGVPTLPKEREKASFRKKLLNAKGDVDRALYYYRRFRSELIHQESLDPYLLYAGLPMQQKTVQWLKDYKRTVSKKTNAFSSLTPKEKGYIHYKLKKCASRWEGPNAIPLPTHIQAGRATLGMECEVLEQIQVQQQVQAQFMDPIDRAESRRNPSVWPKKMDLFKQGWEKPRKIYPMVHGLSKFFYSCLSSPFTLGMSWQKYPILGRIALSLSTVTIVSIAALTSLVAVAALAAQAAAIFAFGYMAMRTRPIGLESKTFLMSKVLKEHLPKRHHALFDQLGNNFLVSNNYYKQHTTNRGERIQKPYTLEQKPLREVLVIKDGQKITFVAIDSDTDRAFFTAKLEADRLTEDTLAAQRQRQVGIYNLDLQSLVVQGKNRLDAAELENNREFQRLKTLANLMNGEITYTAREREQLKKTARKVGKRNLYQFIQNVALKTRPRNRKVFSQTELAHSLLATG